VLAKYKTLSVFAFPVRNGETMSTLSVHELEQIERANGSGRQPVVFVHGLWLLPSSWDRWRALFEDEGYTTLAPGWPDDPETVEEARGHPEVFAKKSLKIIESHFAEVICALRMKPAVIGHSFGGMITEELAGRGLSAVSVAIDPAPFRGVLPLPVSSLRSSAAVLANPANYGRAVSLTFEQFKYGWANALSEEEANELYETYHVPGAGRPLFSAAFANVNPWTEDRVDTRNPERGPLLLISGESDNTVPWAVVSAAWERQLHNPGETEIKRVENRGHSLVIDHGWQQVAEYALAFAKEYAPAEIGVTI
jgi:non-heme chloroperoxidase